MNNAKTPFIIIMFLGLLISGSPVAAGVLDVSDAAVELFLASPFQYDYTTITDDASLRRFIDALDYQLAMIEYRQRHEFTAGDAVPESRQRFKGDLEKRYRELLQDGFIFKKLNEWQAETTDPINRIFIELYISRRNEFTADPASLRQARELSQRIADRLYSFQFDVDGEKYNSTSAAQIMYGGDDIGLARRLHLLVNDSAAILAPFATGLYFMYKDMGQQRGYRTSLDYNLSRLSYTKAEWLKIADDLKSATEAEYQRCLKEMGKQSDLDHPALFEIERRINTGAVLPDSCFTPDKIDVAITRLLAGLGLEHLTDNLNIRVDSSSFPALGIRLFPPFDNLLLRNNQGGFSNYLRLAGELGRVLPWVYADSTLPYLLRDYPLGSEEMLTGLFEELALRPDFLRANFQVSPDDLKRFETYRRWQTIVDIRRVLLYFYFDYYLSDGRAEDPTRLYIALEDSLFADADTTYQWIETLLTGGMETFPEKLAHIFSRIKTIEILHTKFGNKYGSDPAAGKFLIDQFCLPGRSRTIEEYISTHCADARSISDIKRQMGLR